MSAAKPALFAAGIVGSLPKPSWLAEPGRLWPRWRLSGEGLAQAKRDATLLWLKEQEDAGLAVLTDGEQSRKHFVHGFLESVEGVDFARKVRKKIRNGRYAALVPTVSGPLHLKSRVHAEEAAFVRAHTTRKVKITLPGPMTVVDTVADSHYGDKAKLAFALAGLLNREARALAGQGVDVIQFDEPAFNVYPEEAVRWGVAALERAIEGLRCVKTVHLCYGYGIQANIEWKKGLGGEWRQYEKILPALAAGRFDQVSVECMHSRVPIQLLGLLKGKDVLLGVIDVADEAVETPQEIASVIAAAMKHVPKERIFPCTNCGMAPLGRALAEAKLKALGAGAELARRRFG